MEESGEDHVLLKMDVIKAFDRIEWHFLLACLEKCGLGGKLTRFLKASFAQASSTVLLNGRQTRCISLSRSVRQGCPLSPLSFILAFDSLSSMFQEALGQQRIVGVRFPAQDLQVLHNKYADDLYMVIRACVCYILEVKRILHVFGKASGLICAWDKTVAAMIPAGPPPMPLWLFPWKWEHDAIATLLLGAPAAQTIVVQSIEHRLVTKMESKIVTLNARKLSLAARIIVANSLLLGCIWYLITVWAGERAFLGRLQRIVDKFVWAGRSRVDRATVARPRAAGGLGLLGVEAQFHALSSRTMLWILGEGNHPLQVILRSHIHDASVRRWGTADMTWTVSSCGTMRMKGSAPWRNICRGWTKLRGHLKPSRPANIEEWGNKV